MKASTIKADFFFLKTVPVNALSQIVFPVSYFILSSSALSFVSSHIRWFIGKRIMNEWL